MDAIRQVELWWAQGWARSCDAGLGWVTLDWDGAARSGGAAATLPSPAPPHPALVCPADGLSRGVGAWPVASPCPADPTSAPGTPPQHGDAGGSKDGDRGCCGAGFVLLRVPARTWGAQRVPPAGTAGMASCSVHAAMVTATTSTRARGLPVYGGSWAGCSQQPRDPRPAQGDAKGSDAWGGLGSGDQLVGAGSLLLCHLCHRWALPRGCASSESQEGFAGTATASPVPEAGRSDAPARGAAVTTRSSHTGWLWPWCEPAGGWQSPGTVPSSPSPHSASPPGQLTVVGDLCPVAATVLGVPPNCCLEKPPVVRGGERGGEGCPEPREMGKLGAASASWQMQVRKILVKLVVAGGVTGGTD